MRIILLSALSLTVCLLVSPAETYARGFGGGGMRGGGGISRGVGGMSRPSRPSAPSLGASRPSVNRPTVNRPSTRPSVSRPPQPQRPSGGLKPAARPSKPATLPGSLPRRPSIPQTRPGGGGLGAGGKLPDRPTIRPSIPGVGGGTGSRPGFSNRPNGGRPNLPGKGGRPSAGDIGDFLGMDKPLRPPTGPSIGSRPINGNRPDNNSRPGSGNRPINGNRPGNGNRPPIVGGQVNINRPVNIGKINVGNNTVINNRPKWANIDAGRVTSINNRWQGQIGRMTNWQTVNPNRPAYWAGWSAGVRAGYHYHYRHPGCFRGDWWIGHPNRWCGWHYGYSFYRRPWNYWWTVPTYRACVDWFAASAPQQVWNEPVYYDYGQEGNVVYSDNRVYINGEQIATTTEFAESAAALATVPAPPNEEQAKQAEWMPLGTFAVSAGEKDVDPTRMVQLAVDKQGIISGTLFNTETDKTQSVQGQVDKQTQRVAMRVGESEDLIVESGLYNLTQDEAPLLVHFGTDKTENWLLVRLDDPAPEGSEQETQQSP